MAAPERVQRRVTLHPVILTCIKAIASDASLSPDARLTGVLLLIYGWDWYHLQDRVDPQALALPSKQWLEICGWMTAGVPEDRIDAVNLGMSFMNSGPSSYED